MWQIREDEIGDSHHSCCSQCVFISGTDRSEFHHLFVRVFLFVCLSVQGKVKLEITITAVVASVSLYQNLIEHSSTMTMFMRLICT